MDIEESLIVRIGKTASRLVSETPWMMDDVIQEMYLSVLELRAKTGNYNESYTLQRAKSRAINFLKRENRYVLGYDDDFGLQLKDTKYVALIIEDNNHRNEGGRTFGSSGDVGGNPMIAEEEEMVLCETH